MNQQRPRPRSFGIVATLVIGAALLAPFAGWKLTNAEPFPAIILPGSPSWVDITDGTTTVTSLTVVGFDPSGAEVRLDPRRFLDPIPVQYLGPLAWESFGQRRTDKELRIKLTGITFGVDGHHATDDEQRAARDWMSGRLDELGLMTERVVIRYDRVTVDVANGEELSRVWLDEVVIDLD